MVIYTDGACEPNPGTGGWAAIIIEGNSKKELSGRVEDTTNNRMEMLAVIKGLENTGNKDITLYSDSKYVVQGVGNWQKRKPGFPVGWMVKWKKAGWRRKTGPLQNQDLWEILYELASNTRSLKMKWVKGHNGNQYNEMCDELAAEQRAN